MYTDDGSAVTDTHSNRVTPMCPNITNQGLNQQNRQKIALSYCYGFSSGRMVGFLTLKAGWSPYGPLSKTTLRDQNRLCVRLCSSGKTQLYSEIDEEKWLPQSQKNPLILSFLSCHLFSSIWSTIFTVG